MPATNAAAVKKFFELYATGKKAALDVDKETGEVLCQFSVNDLSGKEGNGTPGQCYTERWQRVAQCADGAIQVFV